MKKLSRAYLLIAAFASVGCVLLLFDRSEYDYADAFKSAVECADASSGHCYQLNPGVIQAVHVDQTSSGQEDRVDVASAGSIIHVALGPSAADASLVQTGAPVTVEWYLGRVAVVWIRGRAIPSTSSPASHADFAYIGWILLWVATFFWAITLLNKRMVALLAAVRILPASAEVQALAAREAILPGGTTGWVVKPRAHQTMLLFLGFAGLVLVSARPLLNPDARPLALAGDLLLFGAAIAGFALTLRNSRLMADRASITRVDLFGRKRSWPVAEINQAAIAGLRWTDWTVPALIFADRDGNELFRVTSLYWNLEEVGALCVNLGVPISVGYLPKQPKLNGARLAMRVVVLLIAVADFVISVVPLPPTRG